MEDINSQSEVLLEELFTVLYQQKQSYVYIDADGIARLGTITEDKFIYDFINESDWIAVKKREDAKEILDKENKDKSISTSDLCRMPH